MSRKSKKATDTSVDAGAPSSSSVLERGFTTDVSTFKAIAKRLAYVADRKSTMPALSRVLVRTNHTGTTFASLDLNQYLTIHVPHMRGEFMEFTVDAKALADTLAACPPGDVRVTKDRDDRFAMISLLKLASNRSLVADIHPRDYPKIATPKDDQQWSPIDGRAFASMLDRVKFSVCKDESRFHLNGVFVECSGDNDQTGDRALVKLVTTDGHRLTKIEATIDGFPKVAQIIPVKGVTEIVRALGKVSKGDTCEIAFAAPYVFVRVTKVGGTIETLASKLIDAQFPPYEQVIPKAPGKLATVDRASFLDSLKRASKVCCETRGAVLTIGHGKLVVRADHPDDGSLVESFAAEGQAAECDAEFMIGTNPTYMLGILDEIADERVTLSFSGELDPILVRGIEDTCTRPIMRASLLGVVMPMRI